MVRCVRLNWFGRLCLVALVTTLLMVLTAGAAFAAESGSALETPSWDVIVAALLSGVAVAPLLQLLKWLERKARHLADGVQGWLDLYAIPATLVLSVLVPILGRYLASIPAPDPLFVHGVLTLITWALAALGYNVAKAAFGSGGGLGK